MARLALLAFVLLLPTAHAQSVDSAMDFQGSHFIELGDVFNDVALPFSIEAWVYLRSSETQYLIRTEDQPHPTPGVHAGFWFAFRFGNEISIHYGDGTGSGRQSRRAKHGVAPQSLVGRWAHVAAVVRSGQDISLYVNGEDVGGEYVGSGGPIHTTSNLARIGLTILSGPYFLSGMVDEFRIWSTARTREDIIEHMHTGVDSQTAGLEAYWRFDDADGQTVFDYSPNRNHGTLGRFPSIDVNDPTRITSSAPLIDTGFPSYLANRRVLWQGYDPGWSGGLRVQDQTFTSNGAGAYLTYAHDGIPNKYTVLDIEAGIGARWSRSWFLDFEHEDAQSGTVTLTFDAASTGFIANGTASDIKLLFRRPGSSTFEYVLRPDGTPISSETGISPYRFTFPIGFESGSFASQDGFYTVGAATFASPVSTDPGLSKTSITAHVYPNPARGNQAFIDIESDIAQHVNIGVYDTLGRLMLSQAGEFVAPGSSSVNLDLSVLSPALYIVRLSNDSFTLTQPLAVVR